MILASNPKIVLAGSVNSSRKTLEKLLQHNMNVVGVLGLDPSVSGNVSGYVDLGKLSKEMEFNFEYFKDINSDETVRFVKNCNPDVMFVVGLSQLVKKPLLNIPTFGCIGFHPTKLPEGRGRGAVAWLILEKAPGAATFFLMGEGMDDGPVIAQEEFEVSEKDYAQDVINKIIETTGSCLDQLLPKMKSGNLEAVQQNHSMATYLGKRNPEDGWIEWENSAEEIVRLVRAVSTPLPGAFSFIDGKKIIIDRASVESSINHIGVTGRILEKSTEKGLLIQSGNGLVWLHEVRGVSFDGLRRGQKFGSFLDYRYHMLSSEIDKLKQFTNE